MWVDFDVRDNWRYTFSLEEALLWIIYYALVFFARNNYLKLIQFNSIYFIVIVHGTRNLSGESQLQTKQKKNNNLNQPTINNSYNKIKCRLCH